MSGEEGGDFPYDTKIILKQNSIEMKNSAYRFVRYYLSRKSNWNEKMKKKANLIQGGQFARY